MSIRLLIRLSALLLLLLIAPICALAQSKTATGFYYPIGLSNWSHGGGGWMERDAAHGGGYVDGYYHIGEDMLTAQGSNVYAISDGDVAQIWTTDANDDYGIGTGNSVVFIKHRLQDGSYFLAEYMHIRPTVTQGSHVTAGQVIAKVGPYQYSVPHLHFGVHPDLTVPITNWGRMANRLWNAANNFVDPVNWITSKVPFGLQSPVNADAVPQIGYNNDGRLEVFVRRTDGSIWHTWQTSPGGVWADWASFGGTMAGNPAVGHNADGRLQFFVRGADNAIYQRWQQSVGSDWSAWNSLGGILASDPCVGNNADGRMEFFVRGTDNVLYHKWQTAPNSSFSDWEGLGGSLALDPSVGVNADGRLEVFSLGVDMSIHNIWEQSLNGNWSQWGNMNGVLAGKPIVYRNADGRLEYFVRGTDGVIYERWQQSLNGNWTGWSPVVDHSAFISNPGAVIDGTGALNVFVRGFDGAIYTSKQIPGGYSNWSYLGGFVTSDPAAGQNADGRLILITLGTDGVIYQRWQLWLGGPWADWTPLDSAHPVILADAVTSVNLDAATVIGGASLTGTVRIQGPAPLGGLVVNLTSSNTSLATVPSQITVCAGSTSQTFSVTTKFTSAPSSVTISASNNTGNAQAALAVNVSNATVAGRLDLEASVNLAQSVTFQFRPDNGAPNFSRTVALNSDGSFSLLNVPAGKYHLALKGSKWLQKVLPLDLTLGDVSGVTATLRAGDANNDNSIDSSDFAVLIGSFNSDSKIAGSNYDATADFDCDGFVDTNDFGLLIGNFNTLGDP